MTFFNKKEEVLDIKLTPHGRYLLSIGKFSPSHYCFIDDDIIYDSQAGGFTETQNSSNKRIMDETPKLKTIPAAFGVEANFDKLESETVHIESMRKVKDERKIDLYPNKLGRSSYITERTPAIHISALAGEITGISHYYTGSADTLSTGSISQILQMPQINMDPEYNINVSKLSFGEVPPWELSLDDGMDTAGNDINQYSELFSDNTYFKVSTTNPLIHFKEFNSFNHKENFIIEVYEIEDIGKIPVYKPLKFRNSIGSRIINDMLIEEGDQSISTPEHFTETF